MSAYRIPKLAAGIVATIAAVAGASVLAEAFQPASSQGVLCAAVAPALTTGGACSSAGAHAFGCHGNLTMALGAVSDGPTPPPPTPTPDCPIPNPG
jgi:hypothetical protein